MRTALALFLCVALSVLCLGFAAASGAETLLDSDFETDLGVWSDAEGDDFDWTRYSGGTPSGSTGPSGDHTTGSGYYVYTEASSPNNPSKTALLEGPCLDLTTKSDATWSFWYHLYGASMGTLYAEVAAGCGTSWTPVFSISGDQGDTWHEANINLSAYDGTSIAIRFRGVTGSGHTSDMAVDDVLVEATPWTPCTEHWECDDSIACTDDVCGVSGYCEPSTDNCSGAAICNLDTGLCEDPDILVVDADRDALIRVNQTTGDRTVVSGCIDVSCSSQRGTGPDFVFPRGIAVESDGQILVCEGFLADPSNQQSILRVDPATGNRTVVSSSLAGSEVGSGPAFDTLFDIIIEADGNILVADTEIDTVFRVDPVTGNRSVLTSNTVGTGPAMSFPGDMALEDDGNIVMTEGSNDQVLRVDPVTGNRTLVSSATQGTGPIWTNLGGILVEQDGNIVTCDEAGIIRVNPTTGDRFLISEAGIRGTGPDLGTDVFSCDVDSDGNLFAVSGDLNALVGIDPATGDRAIVTSTTVGSGIAPGQLRDVRAEPQEPVCGNTIIETGEDCDDGNTDPGDCCSATCQYESTSTVCRTDTGECDVEETCDGAGACPADAFELAGTFCGSPGDGVCDLQDTCDGAGVCDDNVEPPITVCRTDTGECDVEETCDGAGACPADAFEPPGTFCGNPGDGICDLQDTCDGAGVCDDNVEPPATVCRAGDECDVEETCDGAGACPADAFEPPGTFCGSPGDGVCGLQDTCDGAGICDDNVEPAGTSCDDASVCTENDECDGAGTCGGDLLKPCEVPALNTWGQLLLGLFVLASGLGLVSQKKRQAR
jgi:streptogramin lyase